MTATALRVAEAVSAVLHGDGGIALDDLTHDSRHVEAGGLFCCVPGAAFDGHDFAADAVDRGAAALLVERRLDLDVPQLVVESTRVAMGPAACAVFEDPSHRLDVIGVTGTNGKTTVVHLLERILGRDGSRVEVFGTLTGARTTPEAPDVQRRLARAANLGTRSVAMEVSSHALDLQRVDGTRFRVVIFTNLGHDHLDHHGSIDAYFEAKARLFTPEFSDIAVINTDDERGVELAERARSAGMKVLPFGLAFAVDLRAEGAISHFHWRDLPVTLQLAGDHNVMNALAAALAAEAIGRDVVEIVDALCAVDPPRGRFEFVDIGQAVRIAVDYAHTPDALESALAAARRVAGDKSVSVVFGCGGDRDQEKRPAMGRIAAGGADKIYVTSDNPRNEDPNVIIDDILAGIPDGREHANVMVTVSRADAIGAAIAAAEDGDVVLIAGKGHETEQVIGDQVMEFDDRAVALDALRAAQ